MVEVKNLTKQYGHVTAVSDLSFEIRDNEILGFLGPNGAGKSTTMNIIAGYLPTTSGTVTVSGHDIKEDARAAKRCIGYLPEIPPLYPDMRVEEYLRYCAGIKGIRRGDRKKEVEKAMVRLELTDMRRRLISNLSKGYKQRVGLAQAIIGDPELLILDEPTVGLDPTQVAELRKFILELGKDHSVILSSHILGEISAVCNRVVIINKGELCAIDTIENLERKASGSPLLILTIEGDQDAATAVLKKISGVTEIEDVMDMDDNIYVFRLRLENEKVRQEIMSEMVKNNINITEMSMEKPDLEQVFLELTGKK
ncbi:ABC-2 type transport system ATP-binding protein [Ruminococcus sp. YE71]|uniref:ABC transporter ATP-binding protein n=1 Tax=unclassified Ruminococcus TaxID=2608920 RepID=UPI0008867554|nr:MULTISPECIES: ATP-binding cassette domain-containing protein [unclassified Ruminococcus]SDA09286.1 ABC-2 type transport system ATP-binding protein [Ruminococcus sp. YE78]SFW12740.1 ABC-2 type transport system ATP-binding protein [Ruminococcus sp. YE71]